MTSPLTTSLVPLIIAGSALFMSELLIFPNSFNNPVVTNLFAENAPIGPSWPVAVTITEAVMVFESIQPLGIVIGGDQRSISDDTRNARGRSVVFADDEVFDGCGIHENDVGHHEHAGEDGGGEQSGVAYDNESAFVFEGDT